MLARSRGWQVARYLLLGGALTGCIAPNDSGAQHAKAAISARAAETRVIPAGAIAVGEDLYRVPVGSDADGCLLYRLHSPAHPVPLAISYRAADGSFTMDHRRAHCDPRLIRRP